MSSGTRRVSVVIVTRDRVGELLRSLEKLATLPERPPLIVIDNASSDGTAQAVTRAFPQVEVYRLGYNAGAAGRNLGVEMAETPYVAFSDDDSWWEPWALARAVAHFDTAPRLGLLNGRILVGPERRLDPICEAMQSSPLPSGPGLPGPEILGFLACGAVVRREAFLQVGGFDARLGVGGEEELLAIDLERAGWRLAYADDVVACHYPSTSRDPDERRRRLARNALWTAWLRYPAASAWRHTLQTALLACTDDAARSGLVQALSKLGSMLEERRPPAADLARRLRLLEAARQR